MMDSSSHLEQRQDLYLPALEAEMRSLVTPPAEDLSPLYGYLHYHLGWVDQEFQATAGDSGKRLRPTFCLLSCELSGGDWEQALPVAAAVELLHNFSLIHDDIEDNDATRRGRPTVWAVWGIPQALNAGDALYALAHLALLRLQDRGVRPDTVVDALGVFARTCLRLTEGQFMDIGFETRSDITPQEYLLMVESKTATLLSAACELGALVGSDSADQWERMRSFGRHLGLAFQIQDDVLGIWGDPQVTGKPRGSDIIRHKKTLPIIYGLESDELRPLLTQEQVSADEALKAAELLEQNGCRERAEALAQEQTRLAMATLEHVQGPAAEELRQLALSLLGRER
jgi:geranylgeranyl diphosphate synthase type I